jgi:hypothetical protein
MSSAASYLHMLIFLGKLKNQASGPSTTMKSSFPREQRKKNLLILSGLDSILF